MAIAKRAGALASFLIGIVAGAVGCGAGEQDVDASSDEVVGGAGASRVTRAADGAFVFSSATPARVDGCKGSCVDRDGDGLVDAWEEAVLARLRPTVTFDEDEPLMREAGDAFASVARIFPAANGHVVVNILLLYARDYGAPRGICFSASKHAGDVERVALDLELTGSAGRGDAIVRRAFTTGHEGTEDDQSKIWQGAELAKLRSIPDGKTGEPRWQVFASQSKHATYGTKEHCEGARLSSWIHRFCASEDCAPDGVSDPERFTRLPEIANVGEPEAHLFDDLGALGFPGETAWGDARFCGGVKVDDRNGCPESVKSKLVKDPF